MWCGYYDDNMPKVAREQTLQKYHGDIHSREFLERSVDENDDPFVKISAMIGGDDYLKVARSLVKMQHKLQMEKFLNQLDFVSIYIRRVLYDLFGIICIFDVYWIGHKICQKKGKSTYEM